MDAAHGYGKQEFIYNRWIFKSNRCGEPTCQPFGKVNPDSPTNQKNTMKHGCIRGWYESMGFGTIAAESSKNHLGP